MKYKNILITGGTGFIGSRLALRCIENGCKVRVFGQENTDAEKLNRKLVESQGAEIVLGAITDTEKIAESVKGIDVVFHLAAAQHEANISDQVFYDVNVAGTKNILESSIKSGITRFVHGSTIGVYGNVDGPVNESSPCNPDNIYGITKLEGERLALTYRERIPIVVVRISETYGPGDRRLLKLFKTIDRKVFVRIGQGQNLHQLIYIDDLITGLIKSSESDKAIGEIILLVGNRPVTTDEMVDSITESLGVNLPGIRAPLFPFIVVSLVLETVLQPLGIQPPLHRRRMDFFKKSFHFSTTKAIELLDFSPKIDFVRGAVLTAQWYGSEGLLGNNIEQPTQTSKIRVDKNLTARIEPFDTFWEAPSDMERGFGKFAKFYQRNYFKYMPKNKDVRILVISCGAGYMVDLMGKKGYGDVLGIDSDPEKILVAKQHDLNCVVANAFPFLRENIEPFDLIFAEQEINHLTKDEILDFLSLCHQNLSEGGSLIMHSLNGANPITGSEAQSQNFNHFNTFTEYSLKQVIGYSGFRDIRVFPLRLYIFYENPANYIGIFLDLLLNITFRAGFIFYGKDNKIFSKKIAAVCRKEQLRTI